MAYPPLPRRPRAPTQLEQQLLARWKARGPLPRRRSRRGARRAAVRVLRGPADRERAPGHPPRLRAHDQGPDLPLPRDAGPGGHPHRGLGHARPAGRDRGREGARAQRQEGDRALRRGGVQRPCRESVFTYQSDWETLSDRIGYWLDYEHPYVTYSNEYIESVWWLLAAAARARPAVPRAQGAAVLPALRHGALEPRAGAGLRGRHHQLGVRRPSRSPTTRRASSLVWTTTPWTLLSNVAVAVHPGPRVRRVRRSATARLILADRARAARCRAAAHKGAPTLRGAGRGAHVPRARAGRPALPAAARGGAAARRPGDRGWSSPGDFVTAEDGSGLVHMAPAFGADDYAGRQRARPGARAAGRARRDVLRHDAGRRSRAGSSPTARPTTSSSSGSSATAAGT